MKALVLKVHGKHILEIRRLIERVEEELVDKFIVRGYGWEREFSSWEEMKDFYDRQQIF